MDADYAVEYWPLIACLLGMAGFGAWVFIHSDRQYLLRWLVVPAAVLVAVGSAQFYDARLGYAALAELPPKFVYLGHHVVIVRGHKAGIEVWAQTRSTRLYRTRYTKQMEQALEQAKAAGERGLVVMERRKGTPGDAVAKQSPYESNIVLPSDIERKEAE